MKADMFVLYCGAVVAAVYVYIFVGGLVLRAFNASEFVEHKITDDYGKGVAVFLWPLLLWMSLLMCLICLFLGAYRLSQWRPRRKSQLPGARVVKS